VKITFLVASVRVDDGARIVTLKTEFPGMPKALEVRLTDKADFITFEVGRSVEAVFTVVKEEAAPAPETGLAL